MKKKIFFLLLLPFFLSACSMQTNYSQKNATTDSKLTTAEQVNQMKQWSYHSGDDPIKVLNHDRPTTIKATDFTKAQIKYGKLDSLNRTKTATAYLTKENLGHSNTRTEQVWRPTGWHNEPKSIAGKRVIPQNRGHLIAYTMTFNLNDQGKSDPGHLGSIDNPYNLFTQTSFSNQKTMTEVEQLVRKSLAQNKKVIYQVTPIFRGQELMARGVWVQAISTDGTLEFNRYLWNVQSKIKYDYSTGRLRVDTEMQVPGDDGFTQVINNYRRNNYQRKKYYQKNY